MGNMQSPNLSKVCSELESMIQQEVIGVIVFGSYAMSYFDEQSDLDVMFLVNGSHMERLVKKIKINKNMEVEIHLTVLGRKNFHDDINEDKYGGFCYFRSFFNPFTLIKGQKIITDLAYRSRVRAIKSLLARYCISKYGLDQNWLIPLSSEKILSFMLAELIQTYPDLALIYANMFRKEGTYETILL